MGPTEMSMLETFKGKSELPFKEHEHHAHSCEDSYQSLCMKMDHLSLEDSCHFLCTKMGELTWDENGHSTKSLSSKLLTTIKSKSHSMTINSSPKRTQSEFCGKQQSFIPGIKDYKKMSPTVHLSAFREMQEFMKRFSVKADNFTPGRKVITFPNFKACIWPSHFHSKSDSYGQTPKESPKAEVISQIVSEVQIREDNRDIEKQEDGKKFYYSVKLPDEVKYDEAKIDMTSYKMPLVLEDLPEALKILKYIKDARFLVFKSYDEAAQNATKELISVIKKEGGYKSSSSQELVKLRKCIEKGNEELFLSSIWEKPKLMIGNDDVPAVLQEGARYNALHVAARSNKPYMIQLILNTLGDMHFMSHIYREDTQDMKQARIHKLLDIYLNVGDKKLGDTPLHFASKFGYIDCVKVLISHPLCSKKVKNFEGLTAAEVACSRMKVMNNEIKNELKELFQDLAMLYVPIFRSKENDSPAVIGKPSLGKDIFCGSSIGHELTIKAVAGPMSSVLAEDYYKLLKNPSGPKSPFSLNERRVIEEIRKTDAEMGVERVARSLASDYGCKWVEYFPFLNSYIDLSSESGIQSLEHYFEAKMNGVVSNSQENAIALLHETIPHVNPLAHSLNVQLKREEEKKTSEEDADNEAESSFFTPPSSPGIEPSPTMSGFESPLPIYIEGFRMTRLDGDVLLALGDSPVDPEKFPLLNAWKRRVQANRCSLSVKETSSNILLVPSPRISKQMRSRLGQRRLF